MSIQLRLDGHSFSLEELSARLTTVPSATIQVITPATLLIPGELFDPARGAEYLRAGGVSLGEEDTYIYSYSQSSVVALMRIPRSVRETVEAATREVHWSSPLLDVPTVTLPATWVCRYGTTVYIKHWSDDRLRLAEALELPTADDLLYCLTKLSAELPIATHPIYLAGDAAFYPHDRKLLHKYFKHVKPCA